MPASPEAEEDELLISEACKGMSSEATSSTREVVSGRDTAGEYIFGVSEKENARQRPAKPSLQRHMAMAQDSTSSTTGRHSAPRRSSKSEARSRATLPSSVWNDRNERNESDHSADGSSWNASENSSVTVVPRSEHTGTGSPPATSDCSSGTGGRAGEASGGKDSATSPSSGGTGDQRSRRPAKKTGDVTTLLISNIPSYLTQGALLSMFEDLTLAMRGKFNFFYCPWNSKEGQNLGFAVINFEEHAYATAFQQKWSGKELCRGGWSQKPLRVIKAVLQGLEANVAYFRKVEFDENCRDLRFRPLYRESGSSEMLALGLDPDAQRAPFELSQLQQAMGDSAGEGQGDEGNASGDRHGGTGSAGGHNFTGSQGMSGSEAGNAWLRQCHQLGVQQQQTDQADQLDRRSRRRGRRTYQPEQPFESQQSQQVLGEDQQPQPHGLNVQSRLQGVDAVEMQRLSLQHQQKKLLELMSINEEQQRRSQQEGVQQRTRLQRKERRMAPTRGQPQGPVSADVSELQQQNLDAMSLTLQCMEQAMQFQQPVMPQNQYIVPAMQTWPMAADQVPRENFFPQMAQVRQEPDYAPQENFYPRVAQNMQVLAPNAMMTSNGCTGQAGSNMQNVQVVPYMMLPVEAFAMKSIQGVDGWMPARTDQVYAD